MFHHLDVSISRFLYLYLYSSVYFSIIVEKFLFLLYNELILTEIKGKAYGTVFYDIGTRF